MKSGSSVTEIQRRFQLSLITDLKSSRGWENSHNRSNSTSGSYPQPGERERQAPLPLRPLEILGVRHITGEQIQPSIIKGCRGDTSRGGGCCGRHTALDRLKGYAHGAAKQKRCVWYRPVPQEGQGRCCTWNAAVELAYCGLQLIFCD